jgi:plastocyanin
MQQVKQIMPFLIGGLVGALIAVGFLVVFHDRNSPSATMIERAAGADEPSENSAHHHAEEEAELGPVVDLTGQPEVEIDIKDYAYSRPNIRVTKGTKVVWTNQDTVGHNVMKEHDAGDQAHEAPSADDVRDDVFAGPLLAEGERYSFTFNAVGSYPYHCAPHPNMQAVVVVTE